MAGDDTRAAVLLWLLQERLTHTIARAHSRTAGEAQEWVRLMLSCVGRGGDGQRIRDEILHIMHRCERNARPADAVAAHCVTAGRTVGACVHLLMCAWCAVKGAE